ncbi:MAG: hypothetical protein IT438_07860 [Phycisphaerales bacterium]|nr:hypothetical protein [Phycisphaerales bacterium]
MASVQGGMNAWLACAAGAAMAAGAPPTLLSDINPTVRNEGSLPGNGARPGMAAVNGLALFTADDGIHGQELWASDGTEAGTRLLKDINAGPSGATIPRITVVRTSAGDVAYFDAQHSVFGYELWRSDGTPEGTRLVVDAVPGSSSLNPLEIVPLGEGVAFSGSDPATGQELWVSDGTAAGTRVVSDLVAGTGGAFPRGLASIGDKVVFTVYLNSTGEEPWVSDGTAAGTFMLGDLTPGSSSSSIQTIVGLPGRAFFAAYDQNASMYKLWTTDGTIAGTRVVLQSNGQPVPNVLRLYGGAGFVVCESYEQDSGIYRVVRSDGTPEGTSTVAVGTITFIFGGEEPCVWGDSVFLPIDQESYGYEPWRISRTPGTTMRLGDLASGSSGSYPGSFTATTSAVYFLTGNGPARTLYRSNGTAAGTAPVQPLPAAPFTGGAGYMLGVGETLYFAADDGVHGTELWKTDGTAQGTSLVRDIRGPRSSSSPTTFGAAENAVVFSAFRPDIGRELFGTNQSGAELVFDCAPGTTSAQSTAPASSSPSPMVKAGTLLYFRATDTAHGSEVWVTDGTAAGTRFTRDINPGPTGSLTPPSSPIVQGIVNARAAELGGAAVFPAATAAEGWEIWRSDGTEPGTAPLLVGSAGTTSSTPGWMTKLGNKALYTASATGQGNELWVTEGTTATTALLKDIAAGTGSSTPQNLTAWNGRVYFSATTTATGRELFVSDGTGAGTALLADLRAGGSSSPSLLTPSDSYLFFVAETTEFGRELYRTDGAIEGTVRLTDIVPGPGSPHIANLVEAGPVVFFSASDASGDRELWISDGTVEGTRRVRDINPGPAWGDPSGTVRIDARRVAFSAFTPEAGYELWQSDGSGVGTRAVGQIAAGALSSFPHSLFMDTARARLLLSADDWSPTGRELYSWTPGAFCVCDVNDDGARTVQDLFDYLGMFFGGDGDVTGDEETTVGDVFEYLACWFGC